MPTDTEPSNAIKLLHLVFLSTSWGMQIWVTFVSGRLRSVHTAVALCLGGEAQGRGLCPRTYPLSPLAGFVMGSCLPRHTYGFIQRELFPYYCHISSACAFLNLTLFAMYHPSELLSDEQTTQVASCFET